jgi:hypothetical protein
MKPKPVTVKRLSWLAVTIGIRKRSTENAHEQQPSALFFEN